MEKSIWLTGSSGFIGKHLAIELRNKGYNIKCFSNNNKLKHINESVPKEISYMNYHSEEEIKNEIKKYGCPDVFIHLGWGGMTAPMSKTGGSSPHKGCLWMPSPRCHQWFSTCLASEVRVIEWLFRKWCVV